MTTSSSYPRTKYQKSAAVINLVDIGPHERTQAHVAGFSRGIDHAAAEVMGIKIAAGVAYGLHLSVAGGITVAQNPVVPASDDLR